MAYGQEAVRSLAKSVRYYTLVRPQLHPDFRAGPIWLVAGQPAHVPGEESPSQLTHRELYALILLLWGNSPERLG